MLRRIGVAGRNNRFGTLMAMESKVVRAAAEHAGPQ
jgi:hypothetical protein